jgi:hypothetical protein
MTLRASWRCSARKGAEVFAEPWDMTKPEMADEIVREAGHVDIPIANLARISHTGWRFEGQRWRLHADIVALKGCNLCESWRAQGWCSDWLGRIWPLALSVSSARRSLD